MGKIIRGYWDCQYCGKKKIDGLVDECPGCGKHKPEGTSYYMGDPNNKNDILSESQLNEAHIDISECDGEHREWVCHYCNQTNNWQDDICVSCGAPREDKKQDNEWKCEACGAMNPLHTRTCLKCGTERASAAENRSEDIVQDNNNDVTNSTTSWIEKSTLVTFGLVFLSLLILYILAFVPIKKNIITVTGIKWERQVTIENYEEVSESGWSKPDDAYNVTSKTEYRCTRQVPDHVETRYNTETYEVLDGYDTHTSYSDNGNGTFSEETYETPRYRTETREVPYFKTIYRDERVYDNYYSYNVMKWVTGKTYSTKGTDHKPYYSTEYTLTKNQRDKIRYEKYTVEFTDDNKKVTEKEMPYAKWKEINVGDTYQTTSTLFGKICSTEKCRKTAAN